MSCPYLVTVPFGAGLPCRRRTVRHGQEAALAPSTQAPALAAGRRAVSPIRRIRERLGAIRVTAPSGRGLGDTDSALRSSADICSESLISIIARMRR